LLLFDSVSHPIIMPCESSGKRNVRSGVCPSVCPVGIVAVTHQGAACDADSVHFGPTIRRTDIGYLFVTHRPHYSVKIKETDADGTVMT